MRRRNRGQERDVTSHLQPLVDDDEFLTALSRGEDPTGGKDPLAALLLDLRGDVHRQMPSAPVIEGGEDGAGVYNLNDARRRRRGPGPLLSGLIGAAAATALVVGSGAALYNATPGSPLWGASTTVFGERTAVLELAGTLDDLEVANERGDTSAARDLLNQARSLINVMGTPAKDLAASPAPGDLPQTGEATVTQTVTAPPPAPTEPSELPGPTPASASQAQPAGTVTQTATVTETVTETVTQPVVDEEPATTSQSPAPSAGATETLLPGAAKGG